MKRVNRIIWFLWISIIAAGACNRENVLQVNDLPDYTYRLKKYQLIDIDDTATITAVFTYENSKLKASEHTSPNGLYTKSHYTYSNTTITRTDTNNIDLSDDSVNFSTTKYILQHGNIVQAKVEGSVTQTINHYYTAGYRNIFEIFDADKVLPVVRGKYTYAGDQLTKYEYYTLNEDEVLVLTEWNEYIYKNGNLEEVFYYYPVINSNAPELQRKLKYTYNENLIRTVDWYSYKNENDWVHFYQSRFIYDSEGNLSEASEYRIIDGSKELSQRFYFEYEVGKGNLEYLKTTNTQSPRLLGVIPDWGLF